MYIYIYIYTHRGGHCTGFRLACPSFDSGKRLFLFPFFLVCPQTHSEFNLKPKTDANQASALTLKQTPNCNP